MDIFVENVLRTDKVICDNIDNIDALGVELLAQNIVAQLRNFVEGIARLVCSREQNIANNQKGTLHYFFGSSVASTFFRAFVRESILLPFLFSSRPFVRTVPLACAYGGLGNSCLFLN